MKKWLVIVWMCNCMALATAAVRTVQEAAVLASHVENVQDTPLRRMLGTDRISVQLAHQQMQLDKQNPAYYIFNRTNQRGFVVVSADDRTEAILGYSDEGEFKVEKVNPSLQWLLNRYARQISQLTDDEYAETRTTTTESIFPLLGATKWDQTMPYFNMCPIDLITGDRSMTGCVATAAAMIMYKWKYPQHGVGTHNYMWCVAETDPYREECDELALTFDTIEFDWDNMRSSYAKNYSDAEARAVAQLMYCCGVACDMHYSSDGSGSFTDEMGLGLITYFGYTYSLFVSANTRTFYALNKGVKGIALKNTKFGCTTSELEAYLNAELEAGRPVMMGGRDESTGGHEFVCDGRDSSGKFHINWGWQGSENGYFTLTNLGMTHNFVDDIDMLLGLEPSATSAIDDRSANTMRPTKWLENGQLYIQSNDAVYTIQGLKVNK